MEENEYRNTYKELMVNQCVYMRTILARHSDCSKAKRINLAEREAVQCQSEAAREICRTTLNHLLEKSKFALHTADPNAPLPYAKQIKVQSGGLIALKHLLDGEDAGEIVEDINKLLFRVNLAYPDLEELPIKQFLADIAAFNVRSRKRNK